VDPVVRIRSKKSGRGEDYILCFKGEGTLARQETEIPISGEIFNELKNLLKAPMIRKDYKVYELPDGLKLECSLVDQDEPTAFMFAEVEFDSIEQAMNYQPPAFLEREVTEDSSYGMAAYWDRKLKYFCINQKPE
jgi:CYTH domain-containing protein